MKISYSCTYTVYCILNKEPKGIEQQGLAQCRHMWFIWELNETGSSLVICHIIWLHYPRSTEIVFLYTIMDPHFDRDPPFDHFKYLHQNGLNWAQTLYMCSSRHSNHSRFHNYGPLRFFVYLLRTSILTAEFIVKWKWNYSITSYLPTSGVIK